VTERLIPQALLQVLQPILDHTFSEHKGQQQLLCTGTRRLPRA
jgi:hypothetical protein